MEKTITIGGRPVPMHGRTFTGTVTSDKMMETVTVEWERRRFVPKYQRYERRRSKVKAHSPKELHVKVGDTVKIMETRPISKTKNFVVIEVVRDEEAAPKAAAKTAKKAAAKTAAKSK